MSNQTLSLHDLELLVFLAQEGSLRRAADRLNLTASALSHRIRDLERRLGFPITSRHGHLQLTPRAGQLIPRARALLEGLNDLSHQALNRPDTFRLGISRLLMQGRLLRVLAELTRREGGHHWEVWSGHSREVETWVEDGHIDVGVVRLERRRPALHYQLWDEDPLVPVAGPDCDPDADPAGWRWVLYAASMGHGQAVEQALKDAGWGIDPWVRVDSFDLGLELVEGGAVSVFPESVVRDALAARTVQTIQVPGVIWPPRRTALVTRGEAPPWALTMTRTMLVSPTGP